VTRIKLPFVKEFMARGKPYRYFHKRGCKDVRLPGFPGSAEFMAAYQAALVASTPRGDIGAGRIKPGTVAALKATYLASDEFRNQIAPTTQQNRRAILERFCVDHGDKPVDKLKPEYVPLLLAGKHGFAKRNLLKALRALMQFAVSIHMIPVDPTEGIKASVPKSKGGFRAWTEDEIAVFRQHHAIGSRARLAFEMLLNTGQRRGDVIKMGQQHFRDGMLHVKQGKTGTTLVLPIFPELQEVLDLAPSSSGPFDPILKVRGGTPFGPTVFSDWFRRMCEQAGLQGISAHGLRKAACRRLAEAGCSVHEIMAISGHKSLAEVKRYTDAADQASMARAAAAKVRTQMSNRVSPSVKQRKESA
jgi:integrase